MTKEFLRQLIDFIVQYGDECTPQQLSLLHRVLNRLELRADDERKSSVKTRKAVVNVFRRGYNAVV